MQKQIRNEYEISGELGSGGMATVYKALQKSLDRTVAIKELKKDYQEDPVITQRFEREAKLAASFQHENIVHIYDYAGKPDFCIIMEFVDGVTLAQIIEKGGPLPEDVGVMIALQAANALEYAHTRGMIHRDIKPGNIMVKRNGEVKLMDFGIARTRGLEALTAPGMVMGTPSYMSPEQIQGQALDVRSDIFSLGIVLYQMFTGVKPFLDEETASVTAKILKGKFLSPRSLNSDVPRGLQRIIKKCLRKKPHRRYASMQELARALGKRIRGMDRPASLKRVSDYLVQAGLVETPPADETVVIYRAPGMGTFTRALLATAAVLLLLTAGVGYYSWQKARAVRVPAPSSAPAPAIMSAPTATLLSAPTTTAPAPKFP